MLFAVILFMIFLLLYIVHAKKLVLIV